ncbi:hypothetical protein GCM10010123_35250 [Pilimelia anulata]|uniref:Diguanylate cyclase n=1 Tax=Pilimelia anulata TaxID=53371 RepID=A0A8J3FCY7_9ACTN|nr:sensor domain-containing diguanylate cyclase [Pilimelia anulata]GGK02210.1 hypothetical protein GCM10010123_35250 [Pilimelia anulata]
MQLNPAVLPPAAERLPHRPAIGAGRVAIGLGLFGLALLPVFAGRLGGPVGQLHLFWTSIAVLDLIAAVAARRVAQRLAAPHMRRFWSAVAFASLLFTVGDVGYALGNLGHAGSLGEALVVVRNLTLVIGCAAVLVALLRYPSSRRTVRERVGFWLDTGTVLVGAAVFRWYLGVAPDAGGREIGIAVLTAIVLMVAAFAGARLIVSDDPPVGRWPATLLIGATAGEVLCDAVLPFPTLATAGSYGPLMLVRMLPALAVAIAATLQLRLLRYGRPSAGRLRPRRAYSVLPYVMVAAVFTLLLWNLPIVDSRALGVLTGAVGIVALVLVRQLVAFNENHRLLRRVDESLADVQRHEQRLRALLRHSSDVTSIIDANSRYAYVSPSIARVLGHPPEAVTGQHSTAFIHPDDRVELQPLMYELLASPGHTVTYQARYRHADDSWRWLEVIMTNLIDQPDVGGLVSNAREVTRARELQDRLRHEASHDPLTQLANRALFTDRLTRMLHEWTPGVSSVTVLVIDLDDFKRINDSLGHHAGDEALMALSDLVRAAIRHIDVGARLGGDEFAILLPDTTPGEATLVAQRLLESLERPVLVGGRMLRLQASVGIAAAGDRDPVALLRAADAAMYAAKQQGKNRYVIHDPWTAAAADRAVER